MHFGAACTPPFSSTQAGRSALPDLRKADAVAAANVGRVQLYLGNTRLFLEDAIRHTIADKLDANFRRFFGYKPSVSEMRSWKNSLQALALHLKYARLEDNGMILEMQLPLSSARLDCLLTGRDQVNRDQAVILELKQWEAAQSSEVDECVVTQIGGGQRVVPHPSVQVRNYKQYLKDTQTVFYEGDSPVALSACSYLHNFAYDPASPLCAERFSATIADCPMFAGNQPEELRDFLRERIGNDHGDEVLGRVTASGYRASRKLLEHVAQVIKGNPVYTLLDDQIVVFNTIRSLARKGIHGRDKAVILARGGPGTGKSLIAINVMAALAGQDYNVQYATGSKAFTENLRRAVGPRAAIQFKYFNSYAAADDGVIDVLLCDEAHRIRESSNSRFTPKVARSQRAQIDEVIGAAKVSVFFIDDRQVVRPGEIGSSELITTAAARFGATLVEEELKTQFRCAGSAAFVSWLDNTLGLAETPEEVFESTDRFEFDVVDSPIELEAEIRARAAEGFTARVVAGFCWPWSNPNADGTLVDDVVIGEYRRPWNAKHEATHLAGNIPRASLWATDKNGIEQIGCIYTAQGFEFDYVGVIIGPDLIYDQSERTWVARKAFLRDSMVARSSGENVATYIKNAYRVLLSRGMKGCFVYASDAGTRAYLRSRIADAGPPSS